MNFHIWKPCLLGFSMAFATIPFVIYVAAGGHGWDSVIFSLPAMFVLCPLSFCAFYFCKAHERWRVTGFVCLMLWLLYDIFMLVATISEGLGYFARMYAHGQPAFEFLFVCWTIPQLLALWTCAWFTPPDGKNLPVSR